MTGILFKHFVGYLRVVFLPVDHGMLPFDLVLHSDVTARTPVDDQRRKGAPEVLVRDDVTTRMRISSALGGFNCLMSWLEAVTCGVQECACNWDGEGPDAELRWRGGSWEAGMLHVRWTEDDQEYRVRLNKAQMVRAFYDSFRSYVESDSYNPLAYEKLTIGETFALILHDADLGTLANRLAALPADAADSLIEELLDFAFDDGKLTQRRAELPFLVEQASHRPVAPPGERRWIVPAWQGWDRQQRRRDVIEKVYPLRAGMGFGDKLRELRSPLIERWLAVHADDRDRAHDTKP